MKNCDLGQHFQDLGHSFFTIRTDPKPANNERDPFDKNFRKFRYKIKWNRTFLEIRFENCGQPPEVVLFSGNLEIPEISCSIWHFYPVRIDPSSFRREKLQDGGRGKSVESTLHWMQNDLPRLEPVLDRKRKR